MVKFNEWMLLEAALRFFTPLFLIADPNGKPFLVSSRLKALLQIQSIEELPPIPEALEISPDSKECDLKKIARQGPWSGNAAIYGPSKKLLDAASIEIHPLRTDNEELLAYLLFIEQNAGAHDEQRLRHQKLELIGSIAGGVVHDLNNILTGILGHISYLRMALPDSPDELDSVAAIEDGARKAAGLTAQILDFARGEVQTQRPIDLSAVMSSGLNLMKGALPRSIVLRILETTPNVLVTGDESQLAQIFMNLTINAAEAMPHGGVIEMSLKKLSVIGDPDLPNGEYARLQVRDNGIGMSPDVQEKIFQPFFTTKKKRGTGLGLANVFSLVRAHNGIIRVHSELGRGSLFEVYLPAAPAGSEPKVFATEPAPAGNGSILVVEDEEIVRTVIQKSLEHLGYAVDVAEDGREAVQKYAENPKRYQLVILDMMMPMMSGDEVFIRLKKLNPNVAVLIASGYTSDVRARNVMERGGLGYIQKPFSIEELAREVRRCLELAKTPQ